MPRSLYKSNQEMGNVSGPLSDSFTKRSVCRRCHSLYSYSESLAIKHCSNKAVPGSRQCGESLLRGIVSASGKKRFYPQQIFCFTTLVSSLQTLVLRPGFIELCESTRGLIDPCGFSSVYDGHIWKDFQSVHGCSFLSSSNNYGLLLNIDWFQPFEHTTYSVGVIFLVMLNLPRSIRFKRENVILYGLIPGPSEPSLTVNSYLSCLVSDLLSLWDGVLLGIPGSTTKVKFRCALLGVSCDLPAGRKTCGFLSHSANLGCSKCYHNFFTSNGTDYGGNFDRNLWRDRTNTQHRSDVTEILKCTTKTARLSAEKKFGCRYSVLLDLPYFDPVRMLLVDPMHNLFMGTAKHVAFDVLIGRNILDREALKKIKSRIQNAIVPTGLGRLPASINTGIFLTAEQWKNWTVYFSIYCLHGLIPPVQLECWRHYVLACRRLCKISVTNDDLTVADALLVRFCRKFKELYGTAALTPNIHMHCHIVSCMRDFGPMYSFWLFPFERYNGILGSQPTNNHSVEVQLMRRFHKDNMHLQLATEANHWQLSEVFGDLLPAANLSSTENILLGSKYIISSFPSELLNILKKLYSKLYPEFSERILKGEISISSTFHRYTHITWHGKRIYSTLQQSAKNTYVLATPPFPFTTSNTNEFEGNLRPAQIHYFIYHSIILPNSETPKAHILAQTSWPMVHPQRFIFGKPVEVWCNGIDEPLSDNSFLPVNAISSRIIFGVDEVLNENVLVIIPVIESWTLLRETRKGRIS